jgi:large subunit ribosomal protein L25
VCTWDDNLAAYAVLAFPPPLKQKKMSQSLRAIKRFRIRELSNPQKHFLTPPSTAASANPKLSPDLSSSRTSGRGGSGVATLLNPFIPHKNPSSGRWAPPRYSLRRQAELIKHARASNTLHLLPPSPKMTPQLLLLAVTTTTTTVDGVSTTTNSSNGSGGGGGGGASGLMMMMKKDTSLQGRSVEKVQQQQQGEEQEGSTWLRREREDTGSVEWIGTVRERRVAGADIGARLYAGKKRMFKGHKWERERERRETRTKILLRDMDKRIQRFKQVRPTPLLRVFFCFSQCFVFWGLVPR